jgi:predicted nucleic acid-binding Zn ribbon protein
MFRSIKESLIEVLGEEKLKPAFEKGNISNLWQECVGATIGENTTIKNFKNGVLTVKTKTPVWRNELLFQKTDIIKKINLKLDKNKIKDIRFL